MRGSPDRIPYSLGFDPATLNHSVTPAEAGVQGRERALALDAGFRRHDEWNIDSTRSNRRLGAPPHRPGAPSRLLVDHLMDDTHGFGDGACIRPLAGDGQRPCHVDVAHGAAESRFSDRASRIAQSGITP
jgi:hypothetical protein